MQTSISTSHGTLQIKTGTEGPKFDPYAYKEYSMKLGDKDILLHEGLGEYIEIGEETVQAYQLDMDEPTPFDMFKLLTGLDPIMIEHWHEKRPMRCCSKPRIEEVSGYPGEHFVQCRTCGHIFETVFCESEII